jgi:predicted nucleic acid-binding protein
MNKYKKELVKKSRLSEEEFNTLLQVLLQKVLIVPNQTLQKYREPANNIVKDIDLNDAPFFACALAHKDSIIWSDDKKLKTQEIIPIINTTEMKLYLQK